MQAPEITISMISVMHGDTAIGFGLVIGSALLAFGLIAPVCYFYQKRNASGDDPLPLPLQSWPICRDTGAFVSALIMVSIYLLSNDSKIKIYKSSSLLLLYIVYITVVLYIASYSGDPKADSLSRSRGIGCLASPYYCFLPAMMVRVTMMLKAQTGVGRVSWPCTHHLNPSSLSSFRGPLFHLQETNRLRLPLAGSEHSWHLHGWF